MTLGLHMCHYLQNELNMLHLHSHKLLFNTNISFYVVGYQLTTFTDIWTCSHSSIQIFLHIFQ